MAVTDEQKAEDDEMELVELVKFDVNQVHLVDTPASGRTILVRKRKEPMGAKVAAQGEDGKGKQVNPSHGNPQVTRKSGPDQPTGETGQPAQASGQPADAGTGDPDNPPAEGQGGLQMSAAAKGALSGTIQAAIDGLTKLHQMVQDAAPSETNDMTIPPEIVDAATKVCDQLETGLKHHKVSKRRLPAGWRETINSVLDLMGKALDKSDAQDAAAPSTAPAAAALAPSQATPDSGAISGGTVAKSVSAAVDPLRKQFEELFAKQEQTIASQGEVIKSLQADLSQIRKSHPASAVIPASGGTTTVQPVVGDTRRHPDLNVVRREREAAARAAGR